MVLHEAYSQLPSSSAASLRWGWRLSTMFSVYSALPSIQFLSASSQAFWMPFHLVASRGLTFFCLVNYQKSYICCSRQYSLTVSWPRRFKNHLRINSIDSLHRLNIREVHRGQGVNEDINSRKTDTTSSSSIPHPRLHSNIRFAVSETSRPGINVVRTEVNGTTTSKVILEENEENEANDQLKRTDSKVWSSATITEENLHVPPILFLYYSFQWVDRSSDRGILI